jgi:hypothetical protein
VCGLRRARSISLFYAHQQVNPRRAISALRHAKSAQMTAKIQHQAAFQWMGKCVTVSGCRSDLCCMACCVWTALYPGRVLRRATSAMGLTQSECGKAVKGCRNHPVVQIDMHVYEPVEKDGDNPHHENHLVNPALAPV